MISQETSGEGHATKIPGWTKSRALVHGALTLSWHLNPKQYLNKIFQSSHSEAGYMQIICPGPFIQCEMSLTKKSVCVCVFQVSLLMS